MISATSEYALRAVLVLAQVGDRTVRADEIAQAIGAPRNYLAKTLNALAKHGVVTSARGPTGGFQLAIPASRLTVAAVVDCFDEPRRQRLCLLGNAACNPEQPCAAHHKWLAIATAQRAPMASTTIADLIGERRPMVATSSSMEIAR